jgi:anti-sigma28 factor (negative regulator of flagellin synthesis)
MSDVNAVSTSSLRDIQTRNVRPELKLIAADRGITSNPDQPDRTDRVELSDRARIYSAQAAPAQPVRADRVLEIKQQLRDGTYLNPDKLDIASQRLFDALFGPNAGPDAQQ